MYNNKMDSFNNKIKIKITMLNTTVNISIFKNSMLSKLCCRAKIRPFNIINNNNNYNNNNNNFNSKISNNISFKCHLVKFK